MGRQRLEREQKFIMKVRLLQGYQVCALSWVRCWRLDRDLHLAKQMGKQVNKEHSGKMRSVELEVR